jgi:hypothetical protein
VHEKKFPVNSFMYFFRYSMRDIVPRTDRPSARTPWSTYAQVTPKISKVRRTRFKPTSLSPVTHSNHHDQILLTSSSDIDTSQYTPPLDKLPSHNALQLPKRHQPSTKRASFGKFKRSPIDIIEEFIHTLTSEDKESVRATYNGPDWPEKQTACNRRLSTTRRVSITPSQRLQQVSMPQASGMIFPTPQPPTIMQIGQASTYMISQPNRFLNFVTPQPNGYMLLPSGPQIFPLRQHVGNVNRGPGFYQTRGS